MSLDADLDGMDRDRLREQVISLRAAIRRHRDASRHDLCWHQPDMWALLPERLDPDVEVPEWPQFMRGCVHYRQSLDQQRPEARRIVAEFGD